MTSLPQRILWERGYKVYYKAYAGNKSPNCCSGRHGHLYRAIATVKEGYEGGTDDTRASKDCTIDKPIFSQATKERLRYKRVDFLGTANHVAMADIVIFIAP